MICSALTVDIVGHTQAGKDLSGAELADGDAPPPTHLLFTLLFLAQVRDAQGRHPEALELLETGE